MKFRDKHGRCIECGEKRGHTTHCIVEADAEEKKEALAWAKAQVEKAEK